MSIFSKIAKFGGKALGGVIGGVTGGPAGAFAGMEMGGRLGGEIGGLEKDPKEPIFSTLPQSEVSPLQAPPVNMNPFGNNRTPEESALREKAAISLMNRFNRRRV